jgi:hypothetical protein
MPRRCALLLISSVLVLSGCQTIAELLFDFESEETIESRKRMRDAQHAAVDHAAGWGSSEDNRLDGAEAHQQIDQIYGTGPPWKAGR